MQVCTCHNPIVAPTQSGEKVCNRCQSWWTPEYGSMSPDTPLENLQILRAERRQMQEARPERRQAATKLPGRNDPCPCGSGKKFKKCCIPT